MFNVVRFLKFITPSSSVKIHVIFSSVALKHGSVNFIIPPLIIEGVGGSADTFATVE